MRKALRPYMTAGVAVVGAGALAFAPVIATPRDLKVVNPAVQQSAGPLDTYVETVREALENLEALLGSALALPAPTGWTLELALDGLFNDPGGNVQLFVDELGAMGPLAGASVPALLENAADAVETAIDQAAVGNFDVAIVNLIKTYVTLAPAVTAIVGAPLQLLGPEVAGVANVVLAKSLTAVAGPVLSGIGSTGVAIQNVVDALNGAKPGSGALLGALFAAPGTVVDGVLNGFALAPSQIALPGLLTPGDPFDLTKPDPGPVSLAVGLARGFGSVLTPKQVAATTLNTPTTDRVVTFEVNRGSATLVAEETQAQGQVSKDLLHPDEGTNKLVAATADEPSLFGVNRPGPRFFGAKSADAGAGSAGATTLRQGIRDGVRELRDGVRDVVKTVTGRNRGGADAGAPGEPTGP